MAYSPLSSRTPTMTSVKVVKYLLFIYSFIFCLAGLLTLTMCAYARNHRTVYQITEDLLPAIDLPICVSLVIIFFGFLGSYGAICESSCMLRFFYKGLLSMFLMLVPVGALGAMSRTTGARETMEKHIQQLIPLSEQPLDIQKAFQDVQRDGFCCGLSVGHLDWGNSSVVPESCNCTDTSRNCTVLDGREIYSTTCLEYMMTRMDRASVSVIGTGFGFGALMLLGMVFSQVLIWQTLPKRGAPI